MHNLVKFIFITGGVVSSLGKGVASGIIGVLLQEYGYRVRLRKLDPYFNIDSGTMQPNEHGEVFVTEDGAETDLDLGHYERFTAVNTTKRDHVTAGKIYSDLLLGERQGVYLGKTVQVIPNVTNLIKEFITSNLNKEDFIICEIGGTVGDIEAQPFLEAIRQIRYDLGKENTAFIHITLVPYLRVAKELKTKPTQHSVKELRGAGIQPDILLLRSEKPLPIDIKQKVALHCNISQERVIQALDQKNIYKALTAYRGDNLCVQILKHFGVAPTILANTKKWNNIVRQISNLKTHITIAIVGKYMKTKDAYKSVTESLMHAGVANRYKVIIKWVDAGEITEENITEKLADSAGVLVLGGFGVRDTEGKILAIKYVRENKIPFVGICLGMQLALIEYARHVLNIKDATSSEFNIKGTNIICNMKEWIRGSLIENRENSQQVGGTMRLGSYPCSIINDTLAYKIYKKTNITERYRHRYTFNMMFKKQFQNTDMIFSGYASDNDMVEIVELLKHPYFIGVQFHPELKSRIFAPHPLFVEFIKSASSSLRFGV
ncbi:MULTISPECIES: CTP synthase [unclassified Candidatus Tisiphia]|uniref:CTP synthase n=1 Tax=unclassified Candidatus Tisiphia TaxID=2996318 RepID=UPI00312C74FE